MKERMRVRGAVSVSSGGGVAWYHVLFLVPPLLLLPGQKLRAEVPCDGELHAVAYEADTLPEDDPLAPWEAGPVGEVDARIADGVLVITAAEDSYVTYGRGEPGLAGAASYDMEVRVWFANLVVPPSMSTAGFGIRDGEKEGTVYFQDGQEKRILIDLATGERLEHPLDWQVPHVYRLEAVRGDGFRVYVDGELTFDVAYGDLFDVPGEAEVTLSGFFGEVEPMDVDWSGETSTGDLVQVGDHFSMIVIGELAEMDIASGEIVGHLDQAGNLGQI